MMKRLIFSLLCAVPFTAWSQNVFDSIRCEQRISLVKKKGVIIDRLHLTESQKSSFWPVYESFELAMEFVEAEYSFLLWKYNNRLEALPEREQRELTAQIMEDEFLIAKIRKQYFKRFLKALPAGQVATLMQLDLTERQKFRRRLLENKSVLLTAAVDK